MPLAAESNCGGASKIGDTKLLEHALVKLDLAIDASPVTVREDWFPDGVCQCGDIIRISVQRGHVASKAIPHLNPDSQLDAIEHLAAKYLEVDGTGRLNSRSAFIRIAEEEPDVANALGLDRIE